MLSPSRVRSSLLVLPLSVLLSLPSGGAAQTPEPQSAPAAPAEEQVEPPPAESEEVAPVETPPEEVRAATLRGRVLSADRQTRVSNASVHAISQQGEVYSSMPSDGKGRYVVTGIPPGTYRLAVSTADGAYFLQSEVGIASPQAFDLDLATIPAEAAAGVVPGRDFPPRGWIYLVQGKGAGGSGRFWRSPKGIILLVATAGAVALILSRAGDDGKESVPVSPSVP